MKVYIIGILVTVGLIVTWKMLNKEPVPQITELYGMAIFWPVTIIVFLFILGNTLLPNDVSEKLKSFFTDTKDKVKGLLEKK